MLNNAFLVRIPTLNPLINDKVHKSKNNYDSPPLRTRLWKWKGLVTGPDSTVSMQRRHLNAVIGGNNQDGEEFERKQQRHLLAVDERERFRGCRVRGEAAADAERIKTL